MTGPDVIEFDREMAEAKIGAFHWKLCSMIGCLAFFDGYDVFSPAYVIHYVMRPWHLKPAEAGLLVSSGLLGFMVGAAIHGMIADKIGRRLTLLGGLWISSIFTLATAILAHSFGSFCLLRIFTGVGLGVLLPLGTTYINEFAPRRAANMFPVWGVAFGWALGGTAVGLTGIFATPHWGWQSLYYLGSFSILIAAGGHWVLPESVKFLVFSGRLNEAASLLARLRPERAEIYASLPIYVCSTLHPKPSPRKLLSREYRRVSLTIWGSAFLSLFAIFGLTGWIPTVMIGRGETFSASFSFGAFMQIMSFIGGLACSLIADRMLNSRLTLALWWGAGGLCVWLLTVVDTHVTNLILTGAAGFFCIGAQFVLNNFAAASYETGLRATGVGMELAVGRIGAILGPLIIGAIQQAFPGSNATFLTIGLASLLAAIVVVLGDPRRISDARAIRAGAHEIEEAQRHG